MSFSYHHELVRDEVNYREVNFRVERLRHHQILVRAEDQK